MKEKLEGYWKEAILKNVPHGEEGSLQVDEEDALVLMRVLLNRGYAICITGGDMGDDWNVHWLYAGDTGNLSWANYDNVVFTNPDYIEDYPQAIQEEYEEEDND